MEAHQVMKQSKALPRPIQRYFCYRQLAPPMPRKALWLLELLCTLQIAILLQPPAALEGDPWDFERFWPLWYLLNGTARGDRMLLLTDIAPVKLAYAGWALISLRLATFLLVSVWLTRVSRANYRKILTRTQRKPLLRTLELFDSLLSLLVSKLLSVPLVACYAVLLGMGSSELSPLETAAVGFSLPLVVVLIVFERVNTCDLKYTGTSLGLSKPSYELIFSLCDLLAASLIPLAEVLKHDFTLRSAALLCGGVKASWVYMALPYHRSVKNVVASFQGLVLAFQAVLLTLGMNYNGTTATLCYLLVTPGLFYLNRTMVIYLKSKAMTGYFLSSEIQNDYLFRLHSKQINSSESPLLHLQIDCMPLYPLIWTAYYYQMQGNVFAMKLAITCICSKNTSWLGCLAAEVAVQRLQMAIETDVEEGVVQNFLTLHRTQEKVKSQDLHVCIKLKELYLTLKQANISYTHIATQMTSLQSQIQHVLYLYKKSIHGFSKKVSLFQAYGSLLSLFGRSKKAEEVFKRASQLIQSHKQSKGSSLEKLLSEDPKCLIIVVQLTGPEACHISWSVNSGLLGYTEEGMKGLEFHELLPACFRATHKKLMQGLMQHQSTPRMFRGSSKIYLVDRNGLLRFGTWQLFPANERPAGDLVVVATLKLEENTKDFCIITANYEPMEMTDGFSRFQQAYPDIFSLLNTASPELLWSGTWETHRYLLSHEQWTFFDHYSIPIVTLNKFRGRMLSRFAHQMTSLTREKQRRVSFLGNNNKALDRLFTLNSRKSNSSYGSNFTTSEGFISFTVKKAMRRQAVMGWLVAVILLLVLVLSLAISASVLAIAISQINDLNSDLSEMNAIGIRRFLSVTSSLRSKELYLVNRGFKVIGNETKARADLVTVATLMKQMSLNVLGNASSAEGYYSSLVHEPIMPF